MRKTLNMVMILFVWLQSCGRPGTTKLDREAVNNEMEVFLSQYAQLLRERQLEKIADLYDDSGIVFSGNGYQSFATLDSIRSRYLRQPKTPVNFDWYDTRIEPIQSDLSLVTSMFYWNLKESLIHLDFHIRGFSKRRLEDGRSSMSMNRWTVGNDVLIATR